MKRVCWILVFGFLSPGLVAQTLSEKLRKATAVFQEDTQMAHAILGMVVVNTETGEKVIEVNAQTGLAPASCQKIFTSVAAFELLGSDYRYTTRLGYDAPVVGGVLRGNLFLSGSGDPTLGSWRFAATKKDRQLQEMIRFLQKKGIHKIAGKLVGENGKWETQNTPNGWIWEDLGNYYGAGPAALNWHENQYDLFLRSGSRIGDKVTVLKTDPLLFYTHFDNELRSAAKGTGDQTVIYLAPYSQHGFLRGTIPVNEKAFVVSGSVPDPAGFLLETFRRKIISKGIGIPGVRVISTPVKESHQNQFTVSSPPLDSINYWFLRKSINLYGEALLKTIAAEKTGKGATGKGVDLLRQFWKTQGIEHSALAISDGSGLSPQNRVTPDALVKALQYATQRPWFRYFYDALPEYNQMKLKSGTIGGVKSFAGYHTAKNGTKYTVAIIVNNYDGSAWAIVQKMFALLDLLK